MIVSSRNDAGTGHLYANKGKRISMQTVHCSQKHSSKWIMDLNVNWKTMKLLGDNMEKRLGSLWYGDIFSERTPNMIYERNNWKAGLHENLKTTAPWKTMSIEEKAIDWETTFAEISSDNLLSTTYAELLKLRNEKTKHFKNYPKTLTDNWAKNIHKWQRNIWKDVPSSVSLGTCKLNQ